MIGAPQVYKHYQTIVQAWADAGLDFPRTVLLVDTSMVSTDPETEATYALFRQFARKDLGLDQEGKPGGKLDAGDRWFR